MKTLNENRPDMPYEEKLAFVRDYVYDQRKTMHAEILDHRLKEAAGNTFIL